MTQTLLRLAADFESSLAGFVDVGDTTATLTSVEDGDGNALTNGLYGFTVDNDTINKEYFVATITGTALTDIMSISEQGATTTGFAKFHRKGAVVEITDWAALSRITNVLDGTTDFDSATHLGYDGAPAGLAGNEFATVAYVLSVVSGGTVAFDQQVLANQTAGEDLTAGNCVYFKTSDQRWYKTDADDSATVVGVRVGFALADATSGNSATIVISGPLTTSGLTAGSKYYASQTAGAITATAPTAPAFPVFVGWALSTTKLLVAPLPTTDQFAGVAATPSATNKFLAQADGSTAGTDQSQTTQNGTFAIGEADATTKHNKAAQSFIPTKTIIKSVNLNKQANTGTFTGTVTVAIQADSAGSPSGVNLVSKTITNALYNAYSTGAFLVLFSSELTVTPGNTYWIVVSTSTSDNSNCINVGTNTAGGYANGSVKYNNGTDGWVVVSTIDWYFKVNEGVNGKAIDGNSSGLIDPVVTQMKVATANISNSGGSATINHGLGKVPAIIRAWTGSASNNNINITLGTYIVASGTYMCMNANYNEGSSGGTSVGTTSLNTNVGTDITVSAVDENVVILSAVMSTGNGYVEIIG